MKRKKNLLGGWLVIAALSIGFFIACNKQLSSSGAVPAGKQQVTVFLNDGPAPHLTSMVLDVRFVEVKVDTGKMRHDDDYYDQDHEGDDNFPWREDNHRGDKFGKWDTVSVVPGLYDLLKLRNTTDTVIAQGLSHLGKITKIRITLGSKNSVTVDSTHTFALPLCQGSPYVYANIRSNTIDSLGGDKYVIRIDFDVARSIRFDDGQYCLKPFLKTYCLKTSGSVEGRVIPRVAQAQVMVFNNSDTAYALPEDEGEFEVRGLSAGSYSVLFKATAPYKDTTLQNVQVQAGMETKLPTITLHQ